MIDLIVKIWLTLVLVLICVSPLAVNHIEDERKTLRIISWTAVSALAVNCSIIFVYGIGYAIYLLWR